MIIVVTVIDLRTIYLSTYTYRRRYITDLLLFIYLAFLFWFIYHLAALVVRFCVQRRILHFVIIYTVFR